MVPPAEFKSFNDFKVRFLDLRVKDLELKNKLLDAVDRVLTHGRILLGPEVELFEQRVAQICQKKYAVGVNSGTDALYLALVGLGIGSGDEVITTPMSWIATANAITLTGATPVYVDVCNDLNMNSDLVYDAITSKTKAIMPVHFTGKICNMDPILEASVQTGLPIVEDAAQAFSATRNGRVAGSFGYVNCFSMNPMKVLNAYGEAGAIVTDDEKLYERLISLRYNGTINREDCHHPSLNGRLDTMQAAMLLVNLDYLEDKINRRRANAMFYSQELKGVVGCPVEEESSRDVYYNYCIISERRDELKEYLASQGIETGIHHPILMPYHTAYRKLSTPSIPVAEHLVQRILSLPSHEDLERKDAEYVAEHIKKFYTLR